MIERLPREDGTVGFRVSGWLQASDYRTIQDEVERVLRSRDRIRLLWWMEEFRGWGPRAVWEDLVFGLRYYKRLDRIAMVGDRPWERRLTQVMKPFTRAEVRYFDRTQFEQARAWLETA